MGVFYMQNALHCIYTSGNHCTCGYTNVCGHNPHVGSAHAHVTLQMYMHIHHMHEMHKCTYAHEHACAVHVYEEHMCAVLVHVNSVYVHAGHMHVYMCINMHACIVHMLA